MKIKRFPRPLGLTMQIINYNKEQQTTTNPNLKGNIRSKLLSSITTQYISNGFILDGKPISFHEYCKFIGVTENEGYILMARSSKALGGMFGKDAMEKVSENLLGLLIRNSVETQGRITYQYNILARQQGEKFVPFLTKELNATLALMINSNAGLTNIIKALAPTFNQTNVQINNQVPEEEKADYLTTTSAIALLAQSSESANIPALEAKYATNDLPIIDAREQETTVSVTNHRERKKERMAREERREREEGYAEIVSG